MLEKIVLKIAGWLLRFTSDWTICAESTYEKLCYIAQNAQKINEKAGKVAACAEELLTENKQLRAAYDALLEEMEELRND